MARNFLRLVLFATALTVLVHLVVLYRISPDKLPQQIDANGNAHGAMDKTTYFLVFGIVQLGVLVGLPALGLFIKRMPNELINVPNKDYWLTDERREKTLAVASGTLELTAVITAAFVSGLIHLSCSLAIDPALDIRGWMWGMIVAYFVFVGGLVIFFSWYFRKPAEV